jgi:hypothetical protein
MELFIASTYLYCFLIQRKHTSVIAVSDEIRVKPSISFGGCGCRYHFYAGIQEYCLDKFDTRNVSVLCSSGGIFAGVPLVLGLYTRNWMHADWVKCYRHFTGRSLYVWLDTTDFLRDMWRKYLPNDAYLKCSGRLFIIVSRLSIYGFREDVISEYNSNEELIDAIIGTSHMMGLFRYFPICQRQFAFDGCFTNLQPQISDRYSEKSTIVCKLFGKGTIDYNNKLSLFKMMTVVAPEECDAKVAEGYAIAAKHYNHFVKAGFTVRET